MAPRQVHINDLPSLEGQVIGSSEWIEIDQDRVNLFADATGDHHECHPVWDRRGDRRPHPHEDRTEHHEHVWDRGARRGGGE